MMETSSIANSCDPGKKIKVLSISIHIIEYLNTSIKSGNGIQSMFYIIMAEHSKHNAELCTSTLQPPLEFDGTLVCHCGLPVASYVEGLVVSLLRWVSLNVCSIKEKVISTLSVLLDTLPSDKLACLIRID